ncbi:MAG: hypothetical protein WDN29_15075 [Methylovirgula sp.]
MGELLAFRTQTRVARGATPRAKEAEILFFTGVRYVRTETYHEAAIRSDRMDAKRKIVTQREQAPH